MTAFELHQGDCLPWSAAEIKRFSARIGLFSRRGVANADTEHMAEQCLARERETGWRDMHYCAECKHMRSGFACAASGQGVYPKTLLHRCRLFGWQVPRTV